MVLTKQSRGLSKAIEEARWNSLANRMESFHGHFKSEFDNIYKECVTFRVRNLVPTDLTEKQLADGSFNNRGMSLQMYLQRTGQLVRHLTAHHTIEEQYIFPILAKRMSEFRQDDIHMTAHHHIHTGLDKLSALISKWNKDSTTYNTMDMRVCLDSWRGVLFTHLDQEVKDLSAENMKKYWTLKELDDIPM